MRGLWRSLCVFFEKVIHKNSEFNIILSLKSSVEPYYKSQIKICRRETQKMDFLSLSPLNELKSRQRFKNLDHLIFKDISTHSLSSQMFLDSDTRTCSPSHHSPGPAAMLGTFLAKSL